MVGKRTAVTRTQSFEHSATISAQSLVARHTLGEEQPFDEIDLELEGGEVVHLKTGDVVIMRGCTHAWVNRSGKPAVTAFMLIDALPVATALGLLRTDFSPPIDTDK